MLKKIKVVGKILPIKPKGETDFFKEKPVVYFSLLVVNPSGSDTILRCIAQEKVAEKIKTEIEGEEVVEIEGYLQNEKSGRQILIKVKSVEKLDLSFEDIDSEQSN